MSTIQTCGILSQSAPATGGRDQAGTRVKRRRVLLGLPGKAGVLPFVLVLFAVLLSACGGGLSDAELQSRIDAGIADAMASIPTPEAAVPQSVIQAERFELVNQDGVVRSLWTILEDGRPSFTMIDDLGEFRAWLFLSADGSPNLILVDNSRFILMDGAGEFRAIMRLDQSGLPSLDFRDETGAPRSALRLDENGSPDFVLTGDAGEPVFSAP
ncbi:MAG: hypothetical protein IIB17_11155 [Chloroflexi bacterium]|nr:hypothetical protein [Chloroflexota bacterium]